MSLSDEYYNALYLINEIKKILNTIDDDKFKDAVLRVNGALDDIDEGITDGYYALDDVYLKCKKFVDSIDSEGGVAAAMDAAAGDARYHAEKKDF